MQFIVVFDPDVAYLVLDQECDIKPEPQTGEAILFPLDFYGLEWPQGLLNVNLHISPEQVQHSDV